MSIDITSLATILTSSFALISFFYVYFKEVAGIKERLISLETKITPFWNWIDKSLPNILKSPHTKEFDSLLDKYQTDRDGMSINELERMKCILDDEIKNTDKEKILLYVLMLIGLDAYINERMKLEKK